MVRLFSVRTPDLLTLKRLVPPTCKPINKLAALLAVSVTLSEIAVGVPVVFQVAERFNRLADCEPVRDCPPTSSFAVGLAVPIPTFPAQVTKNISFPTPGVVEL